MPAGRHLTATSHSLQDRPLNLPGPAKPGREDLGEMACKPECSCQMCLRRIKSGRKAGSLSIGIKCIKNIFSNCYLPHGPDSACNCLNVVFPTLPAGRDVNGYFFFLPFPCFFFSLLGGRSACVAFASSVKLSV